MYLAGKVPVEDEGLKRILVSHVHFIQKVDKMLSFNPADSEKAYPLSQLVQDR
jgi:hypothetical protein